MWSIPTVDPTELAASLYSQCIMQNTQLYKISAMHVERVTCTYHVPVLISPRHNCGCPDPVSLTAWSRAPRSSISALVLWFPSAAPEMRAVVQHCKVRCSNLVGHSNRHCVCAYGALSIEQHSICNGQVICNHIIHLHVLQCKHNVRKTSKVLERGTTPAAGDLGG